MSGKSAQKVRGKSVQVQKQTNPLFWHGRVPMTVIQDPELSASAKCVYACISAHVFQGTTARIGQRRIAKLCSLHTSTVVASTRTLEQNGHLKIVGEGKKRRIYHLTSPLFGQKQGKVDVLISGPSGVPRFASVRSA